MGKILKKKVRPRFKRPGTRKLPGNLSPDKGGRVRLNDPDMPDARPKR